MTTTATTVKVVEGTESLWFAKALEAHPDSWVAVSEENWWCCRRSTSKVASQ